MFGKNHTIESCEKMSNTRTLKWINGEYNNIWKKGKYFSKKMQKEMIYRSSWELEFFKYLDKNEKVINFKSEQIYIPYLDRSNKKRNYIPDLMVEYANNKIEMIEIKPKSLLKYKLNPLKFAAAKKYCKENNLKFKVITEKYLKYIGCDI